MRVPYGLPVAASVTAHLIEYGEPVGTTFGDTEAVTFGRWYPVTAKVGPAKGVGSGKSSGNEYWPNCTPVTLNVPFAVDGT